MDSGAVTPVITAELMLGRAHLTTHLPGDLFFLFYFLSKANMCTKTNHGVGDIFKATSSVSHQMGRSNEESCQE